MKMTSSFERPLCPALISFRSFQTKEINNSAISTQCHQHIVELQQKCDSYSNHLLSYDGNKQPFEVDINTKRRNLDNLSNNLTSVIDNFVVLKSKVETFKRGNNELKATYSTNITKVNNLRNIELNRQEDILAQNKRKQNSYNSSRCFYNLYKKNTGCEIIMESKNVAKFQFSPGFYVTLHSEDWKSNWCLLEIKPVVENISDIEKKLIEVDDVQALLTCLYKAFKPLIKRHN